MSRRGNIMIRFASGLAVGVILFSPSFIHAEVVSRHEGSNDPVTKGWRKFRTFAGVDTSTFINDLGTAVNGWIVNDNGLNDGVYGVLLTPTQLSNAKKLGWRFTVKLRIIECGLGAANDSIAAAVVDGERTFALQFRRTQTGKPQVRLVAGEDLGQLIEIDDPSNGYHTYELAYDPSNASAQLHIDGVLSADKICRSSWRWFRSGQSTRCGWQRLF